MSRMRLVLAQILAHGRARLRLVRVSTCQLLPTKIQNRTRFLEGQNDKVMILGTINAFRPSPKKGNE